MASGLVALLVNSFTLRRKLNHSFAEYEKARASLSFYRNSEGDAFAMGLETAWGTVESHFTYACVGQDGVYLLAEKDSSVVARLSFNSAMREQIKADLIAKGVEVVDIDFE
jgi:hypothetical protein